MYANLFLHLRSFATLFTKDANIIYGTFLFYYYFFFHKKYQCNFAISLVHSKRHILNFAFFFKFYFKTSACANIYFGSHFVNDHHKRNDIEKWLRDSNNRKDRKLSGIAKPRNLIRTIILQTGTIPEIRFHSRDISLRL